MSRFELCAFLLKISIASFETSMQSTEYPLLANSSAGNPEPALESSIFDSVFIFSFLNSLSRSSVYSFGSYTRLFTQSSHSSEICGILS